MYDTQNDNEFDHAPAASLDYGFTWTDWLEAGETITGSTWTATVGMTLSLDQISGATTSVFASGGVVSQLYYLTNTITTSESRSDSRVIVLSCKVR